MEISFTGIQNLYIGQKTYSKLGSYLGINGKIKQGTKDYTDILIKCDLTNDKYGNHLDEFKNALFKCNPCYNINCVNLTKPNHIELLMEHFRVKDGKFNVFNSNFKINNYDIMLDEREILPLFSYMARLTRTIALSKGPSEVQKQYAKFVNHGVHNEAMNFIENM